MKLYNRIKDFFQHNEYIHTFAEFGIVFVIVTLWVGMGLGMYKQNLESCVVNEYQKVTESRIYRGELRNIEALEFTVTLEDGRIISSKTLSWDPEVEEVGALCSLSNKRNYEVTTLKSR